MQLLNILNRKRINRINKSKLKNDNFTLISSNCIGGIIYHELNMQFYSPFINLWLKPKDFIKYCQNIEFYQSLNLHFIKVEGINYPVAQLGDIEIYFQHYESETIAERKWIERTKRMNLENIYIIMSERDGCTLNDLIEFDKLKYKNKVVFTHSPYPQIKSSYYIKGFENKEELGCCFEYINNTSGKKYYDDFPFIKWFNGD